ncbi:MAG: hypothetical protein DMF40_05105 [Verrucomicrobia bacterium]|nr:MAG: hypothetical protein DMF40_05105 [Verrucomicrobiota bacterium]
MRKSIVAQAALRRDWEGREIVSTCNNLTREGFSYTDRECVSQFVFEQRHTLAQYFLFFFACPDDCGGEATAQIESAVILGSSGKMLAEDLIILNSANDNRTRIVADNWLTRMRSNITKK